MLTSMIAICRLLFPPRRHYRISAFIPALILAASAGAIDAKSTVSGLPNLPGPLVGTWKVKSVLVDLGSTRTLSYQRDDPSLVGDRFVISDREIRSNTPESRKCPMPKAAVWKTTAASLMAVTLAPHGIPASSPTTEDFELPLPPNRSVEAFFVKCRSGRFGPILHPAAMAAMAEMAEMDAQGFGTWIVVLPGGDLALRWYDETILVLRRVA